MLEVLCTRRAKNILSTIDFSHFKNTFKRILNLHTLLLFVIIIRGSNYEPNLLLPTLVTTLSQVDLLNKPVEWNPKIGEIGLSKQ